MKSDDAYMRGISRTVQIMGETLSVYQKNVLRTSGIEAATALENALKQFSNSIELTVQNNVINSIAIQQISRLGMDALPASISTESILQLAHVQLEAFAATQLFAYSDMLNGMKTALCDYSWSRYCEALSKSLHQPLIDAVDLSYLHFSALALNTAREMKLPRGLATTLNTLNTSTMQRLARVEDISYEVSSSSFVDDSTPESKAKPKEMNILCSAADFFDDCEEDTVSENELMNFMTLLESKRTFALTSNTAYKIKNIVENIADRIGFDEEKYYHARVNEQKCPFTFDEMLTAPSGVTGPGRYNYPGQSFYYFANTKEGAVKEVGKHEPNKRVQVVEIKPKRAIHMIDLSGRLRRGKSFLSYIRFSATGNMPKAYLVPCFVSDCCRECSIEGIKYYGSKDYNNYVCWENGYFDFMSMEMC